MTTCMHASDASPEVVAAQAGNARPPAGWQVIDAGADVGVVLAEVRPDQSNFRMEYDPSHPAANAEGYVQRPNVDTLVEAMDMREAQRAYEANLNVIETARNMESRTLDIIKK